MAVEIPVVIDIDKAFKDAASRVDTAVKPLQEKMDKNALALTVTVDTKKFTVKQVLDDATLSANQLRAALADVDRQIASRAKSGGFDLSSELKYSEKIMLQAASALEAKINGVKDGSAIMARLFSVNIDRAKAKIAELETSLDDLTRKQNKYNAGVKRGDPGAALNRSNVSKKIQQVNSDIAATRSYLGNLLTQLDLVEKAGVRAATSISSMRTPAMEMARQFRIGAGYVEKYNESLTVANGKIMALAKNAAGLFALHAAASFVRNIRQVTAEFEMQRVALGGIIQDTDRAEKLFQQLKAAAIQSPFEIKDLVTFTKQLSAYRIETENLFDVTMKLADISAGLGVDMNRLVLAYGQVRAASVLRGQELRQFTEAGIPLVELLADKFEELGRKGTKTADVFELISKRAVPFSMIEDIFNDMTTAGGMFYKMQEKQSETLKGQWMKLRDALSIMYDEIGNTKLVHETMETSIRLAMQLLQNWREVAKVVGYAAASVAVYKVALANAAVASKALSLREAAAISAMQLNVVSRSRLIASLFGETAATKVQIAVGNLYVRMKKREMVATNLFTKSLYKMAAALLSNPYAAAAAGIAVIIAAIAKLVSATKAATVTNDDLKKSLVSFEKSNSHVKEIDKLCDAYDELVSKQKLTEKETEKLGRVTKELAKSYPSAVNGANNHKKAIDIDTAAIRKHNAEVREAIRLALENKKLGGEKSLEEAKREQKKISDILRAGGQYYEDWENNSTERRKTFIPLTEKQKRDYGNRILELDGIISDFEETVDSAAKALSGFNDGFIGPQLPEFFGDAWRKSLNSYSVLLEGASEKTKAFTPDQIRQFGSVEDAIAEAVSQYNALTKSVSFYERAERKATGARKEQLSTILSEKRALKELFGQIITDYDAWNLVSTNRPSDNRLSNLKKDISEITNAYKKFLELRKYMSDSQALSEIGTLFPQLKGWEPSFENTIEKLQEMRKKVVAQLARSPKDKTLLEMQTALDTEISNLKFDDLKKKFDSELKRIKDEIKRSETARSFYQDILGLTGDEELAASMSISVYGSVGQDFKDRIKKELVDSLSTLDAETFAGLDDKIREAFDAGDYEYLAKTIEKVPEALRATVQQVAADAEKFSADQIRTWIKELAQFKTYGEKRVQLAKQTAQKIGEINASGLPRDQKDSLILEYQRKEAEEAAKLQYEAFKDTPMYIHLFENLDAASTKMLTSMRDNLIRLKANWKDLDPTQLREMQKRIEEIDSQLAAKNPFKAIADGIRAYREQTKGTSRAEIENEAVRAQDFANAQKDYLSILTKEYQAKLNSSTATEAEVEAAKENMEVQSVVADEAQRAADEAAITSDNLERAARAIIAGAAGLSEWVDSLSDVGSSFSGLMKEILPDEDASYFGEQFDNLIKGLSGAAKAGTGIARVITNPADVKGWADAVSGVVDVVSSIFGASNAAKVRRANKIIEEQEKTIVQLERSYQKLEDAMDDVFGNDYLYNYRKELEVINAEVEAYRAQAEAERSKGKKADEEKAKEYERNAEEAMERIKDITSEMREFFAGSDLTSLAQDFSNAWLDAYREFGNTAGAIEDRMEEMVKNLVEKAALSGIVQNVLGDWYESLSSIKDWNAQSIAEKVAEARALIPVINQGLNTAAAELQAAGTSLRGTVGQFTGISRDYAAASEESINGLAAGVNTQNFFLQHLDMNVAAILSVLTGGASTAGASVTGEAVDPYKDQMLLYASNLPQMRDDLAAIRIALDRVIKPSGNKYAVQVQM